MSNRLKFLKLEYALQDDQGQNKLTSSYDGVNVTLKQGPSSISVPSTDIVELREALLEFENRREGTEIARSTKRVTE